MTGGQGEADEARLVELAGQLAAAVVDALPGWVERSVRRVAAEAGVDLGPEHETLLAAEAAAAASGPGAAVRELLSLDIDAQATGPLALLRTAVVNPTRVLETLGVPPVRRDAVAEAQFPDDPYDLTPASFADIDPGLHEPGLAWGAAKAFVHMRRHRR